MPIYEFKCLKCNDIFELLMIGNDDKINLSCPKCESKDLERVLSVTNISETSSSNTSGSDCSSQNRTCPNGSCKTYNIPGYSK